MTTACVDMWVSTCNERSNPFATAAAAAAAAATEPSPFACAALEEIQQATSETQAPVKKAKRSLSSKLSWLSCGCVRPDARLSDSEWESDFAGPKQASVSSSVSNGRQKKGVHWQLDAISPKKSLHTSDLFKQASATYSDAEWCDARSQFSSALSGAMSDQATKLEELSLMLKDLSPAVTKAPWIPEPPLAFGTPNMQFIPVPAVTGFAAYWERDEGRCTPFPTPIDIMSKASMIAQKSHASIPGIWLQETDTGFTVTVKPRFMPPGLPRYTETYDKSNATEPSWPMRRDLRLGSTSGQIFMTTDGMLIMRAMSRTMFGTGPDYIMEEYMRLEEGGQVIVDRMCCLEVKSGQRATQYVVGRRHEVPPKGHV